MLDRTGGGQIGNDWEARMVECQKCNKAMQARNLRQHLADVHDIYQEEVVDEGLLDERAGVQYRAVRGDTEIGEGRMHPVPTPGLSGSAEHPMDDAQTLSGRASKRHCVSPMGRRSTSALQEV